MTTTNGQSTALDDIGKKHKTDKASNSHNYLETYERALQHLRLETFTLLELGLGEGNSLRTWVDYFPNASVHGVDNRPATVEFSKIDRVSVTIGSSADPGFLNELVSQLRPTVVIDDASHIWSHQLIAFETIFPSLHSGAVYIVEDLNTSFGELSKSYSDCTTAPSSYFTDLSHILLSNGQEVLESLKHVSHHTEHLVQAIEFMTFIRESVIIAKR